MIEKNKGNTKAKQSKKWMEEALFKLMHMKPYGEISIQEITDCAQLSRRTFYRNYQKKDEILLEYFYHICKEYEQNLIDTKAQTFSDIARVFFNTMYEHLDFLRLMNKHHIIDLFIKELDAFVLPLHMKLRGRAESELELARFAIAFGIGGFGRILILWLNEGANKSPDELAMLTKEAVKLLM